MTSDQLTQLLLGLLACAWVGDFVKGQFQKRKVKADSNLVDANATQIIVGSANALIQPLTNRLEEAEAEASLLRKEIREVRKEMQLAVDELREARQENIRIREENTRVTTENRRLRKLIAGEHHG